MLWMLCLVIQANTEKKCALKWDDKLGVAYVEIVNGSGETNRRINKIIDRVDTFTNKSSTARLVKFHDQAWTELYKKKQETTEELISLQNEKLAEACDKLKQFTKEIIEICKTISELDVACTFGLFASKNQYSRPKMTKEMIHEVKGGRHPVVERHQLQRGNSFVANDTKLSAKSICVLTGPNMGGKSTYLRQAAIISILAQSGLFVPCGSAKLGILDQIFTRIGSSDDLSNNESTFMVFKANKVEMKETAHILHNATEQSLIIMDEVGRGTSTKDGLAIAYSIIAYISKVNKSLCLFATHYHELNSLIEKFKVENVVYSKAVCKVDDNELTCLYKIEDGVMDKSHGIKIAEHAGIPVGVVQNAEKIYDYLENSE
jgi:DNA mismatch repair protein MutS